MFEKVQTKMPNVDTIRKSKPKKKPVTRLTIKLIYVVVESH